MQLLSPKIVVLALALFNSCNALKVTILADTNRDGKVDKKDIDGKSSWTATRGALFLANIGDTGRRCAKKWGPSVNIVSTNETYLDLCNDATDKTQRNPKFLAPLKTLPISGLSPSAKGSIQVIDKAAASKVRIFVKKGNKWIYVSGEYTFTAKELSSGLELGIDARDVRRPKGWDGNAKIQFIVTDGKTKATDTVALRVAPVLTHHHGQAAQRIFSTGVNKPGSNPIQQQFVDDIKRNVANAGVKEPIFLFHNYDIWTQDFFEPGYSSMPGPNGPITIRIMIRSAQSGRMAGRDAFHELRNDQVGAVQHPGDGDTIDSTGNLETIPPYKHNGKSYPLGRTIMGAWDGRSPLMVEFLKAQEVQDPLVLDTSWLSVGHVDEFIQFLPAYNDRGWIVMAADPLKGLDLLKKASEAGHGKVKAVSRSLQIEEKNQQLCLPRQTIQEVLKFNKFDAIQDQTAQRIEANLNILKRETGITDKDIFRLPMPFYYAESSSWLCPGEQPSDVDAREDTSPTPQKASSRIGITFKAAGGPSLKARSIIEAATPKNSIYRRETDPSTQVVSLWPSSVNGLVLPDQKILAPKPWGPVINKQDIFANAVSEVYASAGYNVTYQDDWFSHFRGHGDVHCGSNSWRAVDIKF
ncbi:arginine deiminase type-3 [Fusarium beomiforme]|uniref:Arginine deiminase type-3 n=1 Tax=Fusarium beomiforme TaxID=44412 RepID=A0A9P5A6W5_9HYPO|nr:arginine deiminase type-3 [Fusarium beomiforme]